MCLCNYRLNSNLGKGSRSLHVILLCLIQPDTHLGRCWAWHESSRCSQSYDLCGCLVKSSTYIKTREPRKQTTISNINPGGALRADRRSRGISCGLATTPLWRSCRADRRCALDLCTPQGQREDDSLQSPKTQQASPNGNPR